MYRGGQNQWRRGFADCYIGSQDLLVTGDYHYRSVRNANQVIRQGERSGFPIQNGMHLRPSNPLQPNTPFIQFPHYSQTPPLQSQPFHQPIFRPYKPFHQPPPRHQNPPYYPPRPTPSGPLKPLDYRKWEYAKLSPFPSSERFIVLSYNLLAVYLANNHRRKLYFHIPCNVLDWEWRKQRIMTELRIWSADILCFQEVDKFNDLEDELKLRGYNGTWKMRTGDPIDGCAIFWRATRFKLLHEESIEFDKHGLRNNIAQICVLELMQRNHTELISSLPTSSMNSNKVVICNIHVLYNPKRGEMKLGQVRLLLHRAHDVSKAWNDAPIVICGDFNCTPKSPLYNFISEQKLDISGLPRDKVSGQVSDEVYSARPFSPNTRTQSDDNTNQSSTPVDGKEAAVKQSGSIQDMNKEDARSVNISQLQCSNLLPDVLSDNLYNNRKYEKERSVNCDKTTNEHLQEFHNVETEISSPVYYLKKRLCTSKGEAGSPVDQMVISLSEGFNDEGMKSDGVEECGEELLVTSHLANGLLSEDIRSDNYPKREGIESDEIASTCVTNDNPPRGGQSPHTDLDIFSSKLLQDTNILKPAEVSSSGSCANLCSQSRVKDEKCGLLSSATRLLNDKTDNLSLNEAEETTKEDDDFGKVSDSFSSELTNEENSFSEDVSLFGRLDLADTDHSKELPPCGNLDHRAGYNPSSWTPMEIETATGSANCTLLEHPIRLRSTYTEVKDLSGTRDSNGEPVITSYNRCFSGTVDYIWRSEGLQTVRVRSPIPKHAMQWTPGFPTKKWGSDHIALVSELAFVKDVNHP